jgi:hypothetical protein
MNRETQSPTPVDRKQYETPRMTVYGDVREITRSTRNNRSAGDNAGGHPNTV